MCFLDHGPFASGFFWSGGPLVNVNDVAGSYSGIVFGVGEYANQNLRTQLSPNLWFLNVLLLLWLANTFGTLPGKSLVQYKHN